jgi:N-methylhydantoinase A
VDTLMSGPAAGVLGAYEVAKQAGHTRLLTLDMGGTSTDVALVPDRIPWTTEASRAGLPVRAPSIDIETVGAGGGSIAWRDRGGALRVGPQSAGAEPGPACYGQGGQEPTLTDANLVLGRLLPEHFLAGRLELDPEAARAAVEKLGSLLGLGLEQTALGIVAIATTHTVEALRLVSAERGEDPSLTTLVAFGGAGPLIAFEVARRLAIPRVLVPPAPGNVCALGMTLADFKRHYARTHLLPLPAPAADFEPLFQELEARAHADLQREGVPEEQRVMERSVDMRYRGQSYEITTPWSARLVQDFHRAHARIYGLSDSSRPVEAVTLRLEATGRVPHPVSAPAGGEASDAGPSRLDQRRIVLAEGARLVDVYERERLLAGQRLVGPVLLVEEGSTTLVPGGFEVRVDAWSNLLATCTEDGRC